MSLTFENETMITANGHTMERYVPRFSALWVESGNRVFAYRGQNDWSESALQVVREKTRGGVVFMLREGRELPRPDLEAEEVVLLNSVDDLPSALRQAAVNWPQKARWVIGDSSLLSAAMEVNTCFRLAVIHLSHLVQLQGPDDPEVVWAPRIPVEFSTYSREQLDGGVMTTYITSRHMGTEEK